MTSVDVVGVRRPRRREMSMTSSSLGAGTAGLTTGTVPMLSRCARTKFAFVLRDGLLVDGSLAARGVRHIDRKARDLRGRGF